PGGFLRDRRGPAGLPVLAHGRERRGALARGRHGLRRPPAHHTRIRRGPGVDAGRRRLMRGIEVTLHVVGVAVWLGAGLTFMIFGPASRRMPLESWANVWMTLATVQRVLVAPACGVATVTGILLAMGMAQLQAGTATALMMMQILGLLAAILTIVFATPLASRMGRLAQRSLDKGAVEPAAEKVRKTLALISSV